MKPDTWKERDSGARRCPNKLADMKLNLGTFSVTSFREIKFISVEREEAVQGQ